MRTHSKDKQEVDGTSRIYGTRSKSKAAIDKGKDKAKEVRSEPQARAEKRPRAPQASSNKSKRRKRAKEPFFFDDDDTSFSWYHKDCLLPVMNQGECECCWSIVAAEVTAAHLAISTGKKPVKLSNQQLLDCLPAHIDVFRPVPLMANPDQVIEGVGTDCYTDTCENGLHYIMKKGVIQDQHYEYKEERGGCQFRTIERNDRVKIANMASLPDGDSANVTRKEKESIKEFLKAMGPSAAAICQYPSFFEFKGEGIYKPTKKELREALKPNNNYGYHAIIVVGYAVENGELYWLIKNSWGVDWGHKGYIKVSSSVNIYDIMCPLKPTVEESCYSS